METNEKKTILKALDRMYDYLNDEMKDRDTLEMKEILFDWFYEFNNGGRDSTFKAIKERWDS